MLFLSAVFLSGCLDPPAAVGGSTNSGVRSLKVGMSPLKAAGIIGTYQVEKIARLPGRIQACRSYIYDEKQLRVQFVHFLRFLGHPFTLVMVEITLAHANRVWSHLHQFIIVDIGDGLF